LNNNNKIMFIVKMVTMVIVVAMMISDKIIVFRNVILEVWLQLFFKVFFTQKYIKIIFFLFFKNYF
jgi:hypothetical protein